MSGVRKSRPSSSSATRCGGCAGLTRRSSRSGMRSRSSADRRPARRGQALDNLGLVLQGAGRLEEAITAHRDAAAIFGETGDRHGEATALTNLGAALGAECAGLTRRSSRTAMRPRSSGRPATGTARALRWATSARATGGVRASLRRRSPRPGYGPPSSGRSVTGTARACTDRSRLTLRQRRPVGGGDHRSQDAAAIFRETDDRHSESLALANFGSTCCGRRTGLRRRLQHSHDAAVIFREIGDRHGESVSLGMSRCSASGAQAGRRSGDHSAPSGGCDLPGDRRPATVRAKHWKISNWTGPQSKPEFSAASAGVATGSLRETQFSRRRSRPQ